MPKRLIVCCDGTWNRPDELNDGVPAPTNVSKLALAIAREDAAGTAQEVFYVAGVGTRRFERLRGGAFGYGLSRNVRECYRFLAERYAPGDELFFLGFSRGAYTARSTVGLVRNCGILLPEHTDRIDEAYRLYRAPGRDREPDGIAAELFRRAYAHPDPDIHFVGVWDTVGALGIPVDGIRLPLLTRLWTFHDTKLSSHVRHAYQALAIDERRGPFKPTLWEQQAHATDQVLEQVWFAGVHCDVGGGYADPSLSEIPLIWMADRVRSNGLALDPARLTRPAGAVDEEQRHEGIELAPDALGLIHESRKGIYRLAPSYDRPLAADGAAAASTAVRRRKELAGYRPEQLDRFLRDGGPETDVPG
jgi:uncharacterized protein (DUF2235 family)